METPHTDFILKYNNDYYESVAITAIVEQLALLNLKLELITEELKDIKIEISCE